MQFQWDDAKNQSNTRKHGISFERAQTAFFGRMLTRIDDRHDYGEIREVGIGLMNDGVLVSIVFTEHPKAIRIISARKATRLEREVYYESL